MPKIKPGSIEGALVWLFSREQPYDQWELMDLDLTSPITWLMWRYKKTFGNPFRCPTGALMAFARRHPALIREAASLAIPIRPAVELAAYLDGLAAESSIDAVITAQKTATTASASDAHS